MYKKELTFKDYNGNTKTETAYFNLSSYEMMELDTDFRRNWGLDLNAHIKKITEEEDQNKMFELLNELLRRSYGIKSDDGTKFDKSFAIFDEFKRSAAFEEFFTILVTDSNEAAAFITGIVPEKLRQA